jgi:NADH-quinone oxidoreductase subunit L
MPHVSICPCICSISDYMEKLLQLFVLLPLAAFLASFLIPRKKERQMSALVVGSIVMHLAGILIFVSFWLANGYPVLDKKHVVVYSAENFEIFVDFYFDKVTAVYAVMGSMLASLVAIFSRFYLHREEGFKRFFNSMLLFFAGYNIIIFSGNFETLFVGWEFLGISSFLLIAFYRDRYLPVKNAMKVISVYRFSDVCLMLALWLSHYFWHENITFVKLSDVTLVGQHLEEYGTIGLLIAIMLLLAAVAKSAQFPFSSWLPRAMEGPTSSSAIFYGSLSVHIGVFLLLRTYPFWESMPAIKIAIVCVGVFTSIIAAGIASVQSTVKTQIAYSSIVQIGIIFIEVALGFHNLALFHFAANAFLRTYQLLVSPSVLNYLVHDKFFSFKPKSYTQQPGWRSKLSNTFYLLFIKEFNLDFFQYRYLWSPFKWVGRRLGFLGSLPGIVVMVTLYVLGLVSFGIEVVPGVLLESLPEIYLFIALLPILRAFADRGDARKTWLLLFLSQLFVVLGISLNTDVTLGQVLLYIGGTVLSAVVGYACLSKMKTIDNDIDLHGFHGYTYEKPGTGFLFLLSCLGMLGFPITPTFIGVDLYFSHIGLRQIPLITLASLCFVFIELAVIRIYARVFMGQHKKAYHAIAFKSS